MGDYQQTIISLDEGWTQQIKAFALDRLETILEEGSMKQKCLFNRAEYSKIYTVCYNMCTQKQPFNWSEQLYERHGETIATYLTTKVLPALREKHGDLLLLEFVKRGDNHMIMNKWYTKFFMYLDRYHVKYQQLPCLNDAGMRKFKTIVYDGVKKDVTTAVLTCINDEREGRVIDRDLIKKCVQIYIKMGMGNLDAYESDFEVAFLDATREYYARNADHWIIEESTPSYLKRVEAILEDEVTRVANYLSPTTETKLLQTLEKEMLEKRKMALLEREGSGCRAMLINDMFDDLSRLFRLFSRVTEGLEPIAAIFKQHVSEIGHDKITQRLNRLENPHVTAAAAAAASNAGGEGPVGSSTVTAAATQQAAGSKEGNDDPIFIKDLLFVHDKHTLLVTEQFQSNALFQKAMKDAFTELVNQDCGKYTTADLIATFCDRLLKSSSEKISELEIEQLLEKSVQLFSYLSDKDLFAEIYRNQLAKRLLNQRSASDDTERVMIGKLKLRCGAQFTAKMEGMLNDLAICHESSTAFDTYTKDHPDLLQASPGSRPMEFVVQVLTTGHWPAQKALDQIRLPHAMHKATTAFADWHQVTHPSRRLTWSFALGSALVKGTFNKKSYDIQVSTLQAVVMLSFNSDGLAGAAGSGALSFMQLMESLDMPEEILKKVLHSLSCGKFKVIKRIVAAGNGGEGGEASSKLIHNSDSFVFNDAFTCPMRKIRIPMALLEDNHDMKRVDENRSVMIEAAAVRIMKARKTLEHGQLISEILGQLSYFRPDPKLVKRRIEALIEREFLERDPENPNFFRYLA
jgi:cullin 1